MQRRGNESNRPRCSSSCKDHGMAPWVEPEVECTWVLRRSRLRDRKSKWSAYRAVCCNDDACTLAISSRNQRMHLAILAAVCGTQGRRVSRRLHCGFTISGRAMTRLLLAIVAACRAGAARRRPVQARHAAASPHCRERPFRDADRRRTRMGGEAPRRAPQRKQLPEAA